MLIEGNKGTKNTYDAKLLRNCCGELLCKEYNYGNSE